MKRIMLITLLLPFTSYSHAIEKCVDADGRVQYGDYCSLADPVEIESVGIQGYYRSNEVQTTAYSESVPAQYGRDASEYIEESARLVGNLPYGTPGDKYKRESKLELARIVASIGQSKMGKRSNPQAEVQFNNAIEVLQKLPYGTPGDRYKRQSMYDQARVYVNLGRTAMGLSILKEPVRKTDEYAHFGSSKPVYKYKSDTGQEYQYDLSNPLDRIEYEVDIDAQLRDKANPLLNEIDRNIGQYGGGAKQ